MDNMTPLARSVTIPIGMPPGQRAIIAAQTYFGVPLTGRQPETVEARRAVMLALRRHGWNLGRIARALGVDRSTVKIGLPFAELTCLRSFHFADGVDHIAAVLANP
ncbi:helix-turn-helix domain-containing protein [Novosphingobium colocasiae]|uniref:helix-turn-helix domain-containing protein n=1 Tax=Novosphingobium colocasiae TaxID=1256513 RepID=UPI0035ADC302